jgi:carbonic anhydrase
MSSNRTVTAMTQLLERNAQFADGYAAVPLGLPAARLIVVTCLDHRLDPAAFLGLRPGDAPVIRNAGGRVTPAVIDDIAYLAFLGGQLSAGAGALQFEVAVIHHTECGTGFLADPGFRQQAAAATGLAPGALAAAAVVDPRVTVGQDVARLLAAPALAPPLRVSGHVYDTATGRVSTVAGARSR